MKNKGISAGIVIAIILIIAVGGLGAYLLLSGGGGGGVVATFSGGEAIEAETTDTFHIDSDTFKIDYTIDPTGESPGAELMIGVYREDGTRMASKYLGSFLSEVSGTLIASKGNDDYYLEVNAIRVDSWELAIREGDS